MKNVRKMQFSSLHRSPYRIYFKIAIGKNTAVYSEKLICIIRLIHEQTALKLNN